jgi:sugar phosphate isomerase/epimerase
MTSHESERSLPSGHEARGKSRGHIPVNRRRLLGVSAALAGAATLGGLATAPTAADAADASGEATRAGHVVPRGHLALQQYSVRDAVTRLDRSVMGYLGGRNFPDDPTDLGPLVPLPGGFSAVFAYLSSVGYDGIEFFQFSQGANGPITIEELRAALDANGLVSSGTHTGGLPAMIDPAYRQGQIDIARTLGHRMIGTAGNPFPGPGPGQPPSGLLGDWQKAANDANTVGRALRSVGLKYFFHPEQDFFRFFSDPAHPELDHVHRMDWFTDNTDPRYVFFEPDTTHTLAGRQRFPDPVDGRLFDHNRWFRRLDAQNRLIAWHIKDSIRTLPLQTTGVNPFLQTVTRPGFFANPDVVYVGEGTVGQGYPVDPDPQVLGFQRTFTRFKLSIPGWFVAESDEAVGGTADPGRSLRHAKVSAAYLRNLRKSEHGCDDNLTQ